MNEKENSPLIQNTKYLILDTHFLSGLTLVELITSFAILGVLSLMIGSVYLAHFRLFSNQSKSIDTSAQNKIAIEEVSNQIRESSGVVTSCHALNPCGGYSSNNPATLVLQLWLLVNNVPTDPGTNNPYDYVVYRLNGSNFVKSVYPRNTPLPASTRTALNNKIIASNVQTLTFTYENEGNKPMSNWVNIALTTQPKNSKETPFTQTVKVYLRNK